MSRRSRPVPKKENAPSAPALHVSQIMPVLKDANSGLQTKIVRNLGDFTVALLAFSENPESLVLAGTGTLLTTRGAHFILTARHVWEEKLKLADEIGIVLRPYVKHSFGISRKDFAVFGLPKPRQWTKWGPDIALLRVPPEYVGSIAAHKVFLNVEKPRRKIGLQVLEIKVLMGTPAAFGKISGTSADLQIMGMFLAQEKQRKRNGFDYLDYSFDLGFPGVPRKFGGVSGGGVWSAYLYYSPQTGEIDWRTSLHGVAFYQLEIINERRSIRCHGPGSIRKALRLVPSRTQATQNKQSIFI
jgi:hypothetical protein